MENKFTIPNIPPISIGDTILLNNDDDQDGLDDKESTINDASKPEQDKDRDVNTNNDCIVDSNSNKLCKSCSKLLLRTTIETIQTCLNNLLNIIDYDVLRDYHNEQQQQQQKLRPKPNNETKCNQITGEHHRINDSSICQDSNDQITVSTVRNDVIIHNNDNQQSNETIQMNLRSIKTDLSNQIYRNLLDNDQINSRNHNSEFKHPGPHNSPPGDRHFDYNNESQTIESQRGVQQHHQQGPGNHLNSDSQSQSFDNQHQSPSMAAPSNIGNGQNIRNESPTSRNLNEIHKLSPSETNSSDYDDHRSIDGHQQHQNVDDSTNQINDSSAESSEFNGNQIRINANDDTNHGDDQIKSSQNCPYAYVTIISNNLQAINALIMINSLLYYNNHNLIVYDNNNNDRSTKSARKSIQKHYRIPLILIINDDGNGSMIDRNILSLLDRFFDHIIRAKSDNMSIKSLLDDEHFGIKHLKIYLWKYLAAFEHLKKCIYLESNLLIVGEISNLFVDYDELTACVDCFYPDYFNCSLFLFEPSVSTYENMIRFASKLSLSNDIHIKNGTEHDLIDEMTLLNEYFKNRWKRLSFIYNFVNNNASYTQQAAYFRFGGNIRVVNFGHHHYNFAAKSNVFNNFNQQQSSSSSSIKPWNYRFNVNSASLMMLNANNNPFESYPIDDYYKFYLLIFIRRIWPILSMNLTPIMIETKQNEWSVTDLISLIDADSINQNGSKMNHYFDQNSFTLRRRKSSPMINDPRVISNDDNHPIIDNDGAEQQGKSLPKIAETEPKQSVDKNAIKVAENEWQSGEQIDWMYQHQSDRIIDRLLMKFS